MNEFTSFLWLKADVSCFKEILLLNFTDSFELWIHFIFDKRILYVVLGGLIMSCKNPLYAHAMVVLVVFNFPKLL